jgi:hypothetical protein
MQYPTRLGDGHRHHREAPGRPAGAGVVPVEVNVVTAATLAAAPAGGR